MRMMHMESLAL